MNSLEAIKVILPNLKDSDIALFTTGFISRYAFFCNDRKANFYMIGSMGLVSSVGLGIALNTRKKVFIFDGDGSVMMDLGTLAMIAKHKPKNLFHIVLDNEVYQSTGAQATISREIDLASIADAAGYRYIARLNQLRNLEKRFIEISHMKGPVLLLIKVKESGALNVGRVLIPPQALTIRFGKEIKRQVA